MSDAGSGGGLRRELGVYGATMMGLGSIAGTGIFVSIGLGVSIAGPSVVLAIALAAVVAACNALSSAQLAASHPTSGGTYEYGYVYLKPWLGFSAGWMFLCAKSASAATAALGFAGYVALGMGWEGDSVRLALAGGCILALVLLVLSGLRRSNLANSLIVSITMGALAVFVAQGIPDAVEFGSKHLGAFFDAPAGASGSATMRLLEATALMFVAYTGYGRIATMGEEVREPRRTIPRAIILTLSVSMVCYMAVGLVGVSAVGADGFVGAGAGVERGAPLAAVAELFGGSILRTIVSVGAITAMLGVLLNLILGLSRVALAMGRRGDLPRRLARLNTSGSTPTWAVLFVGAIIMGLAMVGSIKLAWSFSAFTVLVYYAVTNLAAINLSPADRLYHPGISWVGLLGCLGLAFWVEPRAWIAGLIVLLIGLIVVRPAMNRLSRG